MTNLERLGIESRHLCFRATVGIHFLQLSLVIRQLGRAEYFTDYRFLTHWQLERGEKTSHMHRNILLT